jgi:fatty-acyl-CoA synthase
VDGSFAASELTATTVPQALVATVERGTGAHVFHLDEGIVEVPFRELAERAARRAGTLARRGVRPGDRVGLIGPNRPQWAAWAFATWWSGAVLVPIGFPLRVRDRSALAEQVASVVRTAGCRVVVADPGFLDVVPVGKALDWDEPAAGADAPLASVGGGDPAVIQFTSGSTASPKGVVLTHGAILEHMRSHLALRPFDPATDRILGWVPLFHDMGLFRYLVASAVFGLLCDLLPTERFARDPAEWLRLATECGTTTTSGPTSGWGSAVRGAIAGRVHVDLSGIRRAAMGGESVAPDVVDRIVAAAEGLGLHPGALIVGYGLAETVAGVTTTVPGDGMRFDRIDLHELVAAGRAVPSDGGSTKRVACCGRPYPGMELRVMGPDGPLPERRVGDLQVKGNSVMSGYVSEDVRDPFVDGWLQTGDLGYIADGELYVTGRAKDLIIVMGRNYFPDDFEWAAQRVEGVRPGRCAAFSIPEREEVVVLVEPSEGADPRVLRDAVSNAILNAIGIRAAEVVVLTPGTVLKTSSGKLRRSAMREAHARGELEPIA